MESKHDTVSLILVLALVGGAWAGEQGTAKKAPAPLSNTLSASCIVNITVDPEIVPLTPQTAVNLVLSSAVAAKAAREVLGVNEQALGKLLESMTIEWLTDSVRPAGRQPGYGAAGNYGRALPGGVGRMDAESRIRRLADMDVESRIRTLGDMNDAGANPGPRLPGSPYGRGRASPYGAPVGLDSSGSTQQSATVRVAVTLPPDVKPAAEEFLRAVIENLRGSLSTAYRAYLDELSATINQTQQRRDKAQEELNQMSGGKANSGGSYVRISLEPNADIPLLKETKRRLEIEVQDRKMSLGVMEARQKAIEEQIAELRVQAAKKLADDTVTQELQTIIKGNADALQNMEKMAAAGRVSESDLAKARESLARARIDLAKRKEELAGTSGGGQLDSYTNQIGQMAIQMAEERTRFDLLGQRLADVNGQLAQASAHDPSQLVPRVRMAQELVNALDTRVGELKMQQGSAQPPTVTVIGAN